MTILGTDIFTMIRVKRLYEDEHHKLTDFLAPHLTYEEMIGALLVGRAT